MQAARTWDSAQGTERLGGVVGIAEGESGGAVLGDDVGVGLGAGDEGLAHFAVVVESQHRAGGEERGSGGDEGDSQELALDGSKCQE